MGVYATYCGFCGLPVQRDHYVTPGGEPLDGFQGLVRIWRVGDPEPAAVPFSEAHAWLDDAVAVSGNPKVEQVLEGRVHDGHLDDGRGVTHDVDGMPTLHRACWEQLGRPRCWKPAGDLPANEVLKPFQGQLFDFAGLVAAGAGAWLEDPRRPDASGRPREWREVQADIYAGRKPSPVVKPPTLLEIIAAAHQQKADLAILAPDQVPVLRQKQKALAHALPAWPFEHWKRQVFAVLPPQAMEEVFSTGDTMTRFQVAGVGLVKLYVHYVTPASECAARVILGGR